MVDIHTHIIPGFDDGSRSFEESLEMARFESLGGTRFMFATPHVQSHEDIKNSGKILDLVDGLNAQFSEQQINLSIIPGAELFPSRSIIKGLDDGLPITLANAKKYVLLDLPHSQLPMDFDTIIFEIQSRGITPILAHPERCPHFQPYPERVLPYVQKGVSFQLNMGSFAGRHGPNAERCAYALFDMKLAHFLASDAHRVKAFNLGEIATRLRAKDAAYVKLLTELSGQAVIDGTALPTLPEPVMPPEKKASWISKLFPRFGQPSR